MLIKLLKNSGVDDKGHFLAAGKTFDVTKELAEELLRIGRAVLPKPKVEATRGPILENVARRVGRPPKVNE